MSAIRTLIVGAVGATLCAGAASAGAWTQAEGAAFSSQSARYFTTKGAEGPVFEKASIGLYFEYGLTDRITIGGELDQGRRLDDAGLGAQSGRVGGFLRARVWRGRAGDVASIEAGASTPLNGFELAAAPGGDDAREFRVRALYGRGFATGWGDAWVEGLIGASHLTGGRADEIELDLTAGLKPDENWIVMAQMFGTLGLRNAAFGAPDFDVAQAKLSVGRRLFGEQRLLIGVARDLYTRGTDKGLEVSLSLWRRF